MHIFKAMKDIPNTTPRKLVQMAVHRKRSKGKGRADMRMGEQPQDYGSDSSLEVVSVIQQFSLCNPIK